MPTTSQDLIEQEKRLKQAGGKATRLSGVGSQFISNVKEELRKRAQDKGVTELGKAAATSRKAYTTAPSDIREQYPDISPQKRMSAEAERRGTILAELTEIADLKSQRQASVTDILGGMKGGIEAETEQAKQSTLLEQQLYTNMFGRYQQELQDTWKQKEFEQADVQMKITQSYNEAMIAIQEGNQELAGQKFEEVKRHELLAEQLGRDSLSLQEELSYAQMASSEKQTFADIASRENIARNQISGRAAPDPTYDVDFEGQKISGLSPSQKLSWEAGLKEESDKKKEISDAVSLFKSQGKSVQEIVDIMDEAGYKPAEYASDLANYQPPAGPSILDRLKFWD